MSLARPVGRAGCGCDGKLERNARERSYTSARVRRQSALKLEGIVLVIDAAFFYIDTARVDDAQGCSKRTVFTLKNQWGEEVSSGTTSG